MLQYIIRRVLMAIPVLIGILIITFVLARAIPGDPCRAVLGERATDKICEAFFERNGLNEPIPVQLLVYARNILLEGDFGTSLRFQRPVADMLAERLPVTLELTLAAITFAVLVGIPLGIISAVKRNTPIDTLTMMGANIGVSMPVFWLGLMLSFVFSVWLRDTPFVLPPSNRLVAGANYEPFYMVWGLVSDPKQASNFLVFMSQLNIFNGVVTLNFEQLGDAMRHLILPAVAVGTIPLAIIARMTRSSLLEVLHQDYVRTAHAKGLSQFTVIMRHATRNALLPVVTIIGLNFGFLVSGAVLTETIFGLTGIGKTLVDGITARDYILVQGVVLLTAISFVFINLFIDLLYGYLDPRIRVN